MIRSDVESDRTAADCRQNCDRHRNCQGRDHAVHGRHARGVHKKTLNVSNCYIYNFCFYINKKNLREGYVPYSPLPLPWKETLNHHLKDHWHINAPTWNYYDHEVEKRERERENEMFTWMNWGKVNRSRRASHYFLPKSINSNMDESFISTKRCQEHCETMPNLCVHYHLRTKYSHRRLSFILHQTTSNYYWTKLN